MLISKLVKALTATAGLLHDNSAVDPPSSFFFGSSWREQLVMVVKMADRRSWVVSWRGRDGLIGDMMKAM